jgi:hypothetical protein
MFCDPAKNTSGLALASVLMPLLDSPAIQQQENTA